MGEAFLASIVGGSLPRLIHFWVKHLCVIICSGEEGSSSCPSSEGV